MSIYKRGRNWYIDFTFEGQRIRESAGPSRKLAEDLLGKRKVEIRENKFFDVRKDPDPLKLHDFAKEYLEWAKVNKTSSSYDRDLSTLRGFEEAFPEKTIQEITTWDIEKWKAKRKAEVKPATTNRDLATVKHLYSKAIEWKKVKENPAKGVRLLKGEVKRVRYLVPEEVQRLLSNCADHLRPIVTVAIHTGMRRSELLGLKWDQVDFEKGIISLLVTKNHERRDISMNETVKATLKEMERRGSYVFSDRDGSRFKRVDHSLKTALEKTGIEDFRFHDLRHTFASNLVMAGLDLDTVAELMGHKKLEMTRRYAHLSPGHKTRAVNVLDRIMSQKPSQEDTVRNKVISISR
jgi:integrase